MNQHTLHDLINNLSHDLKPVKPLPHIAMITILWAVVLLSLGFTSAYLLNAPPKAWQLPHAWPSILNGIFSILIGVWALSRTFLSQIPAYKFKHNLFKLVLSIWFFLNVTMVLISKQPFEHLGHSTPCYFFVLATGIPMLILSMVFLRRYRFIQPLNMLKSLSLSCIFLSFALLSLCHSSHLGMNDFLMHMLGAITLTALCLTIGSVYLRYKH